MLLFQVKSFDSRGSTMLELIVMMAIMGLGIAAMLGVIESGVYFAKDTEDTVKAINLARDGMEAVTNIRNTNWQRFSSDRINCWKVKDYDASCIGTGGSGIASGSYIVYTQNGIWFLSGAATIADPFGQWASYKNTYRTYLDASGFYAQTGVTTSTGCSSDSQKNCLTQFTREIRLGYSASDTGTLIVESIVRWRGKRDREIIINGKLTNWKSKF